MQAGGEMCTLPMARRGFWCKERFDSAGQVLLLWALNERKAVPCSWGKIKINFLVFSLWATAGDTQGSLCNQKLCLVELGGGNGMPEIESRSGVYVQSKQVPY